MRVKGFKLTIPEWKIRLTALPIIIFAITATMSIGTIAILWTQRTKDRLLVSTNEEQLGSTASMLFDMRHNEYNRLVFDYSFWDDMVTFTKSPSREWSSQNLDILLSTYNASAVIVLNIKDSIIYIERDSLFAHLPKKIIKPWIVNRIKKEKVFQTFIEQDSYMIEISGATIHPTADEKRKTKPCGILIACKIWDQSVIDIFSKAISGQAEFRNTPLESDLSKAKITYNLPIKGDLNNTLKYLTLTKSIKGIIETRGLTQYVAIATLILAIISTILLLIVIRRMITKPLILLGEIISGKDTKKSHDLKHYGTQFIYLGELMEAYLKQREELKEALEKATESDRFKSAFLANMSHEIRTPLNGIIGFSQLVCSPNITNEKRLGFQETIAKCGDDLLRIINDILDISKIESGQVKISTSWFSVLELLKELETLYPIILKQYRKEHLKIRFHLPQSDMMVCLDKSKVKQILVNLINNAVKYTKEGRIDVLYKTNNGTISFEVKDTGEGIPSEEQQKVFQCFMQVSKENEKQTGVGLGLSIAKGLTTMQNGTIALKSELGQGSTFSVSFPTFLPLDEKDKLRRN